MDFWDILMIFLPIAMLAGGFWGGMRVSDRYHADAERELRYALAHQYDRLRSGVDADDPCQPYTCAHSNPIDDQFMTKLATNGQAIKWLNKERMENK